jgi:hypothetical protein
MLSPPDSPQHLNNSYHNSFVLTKHTNKLANQHSKELTQFNVDDNIADTEQRQNGMKIFFL